MHASFSFHHSNLQLASTTQSMDIWNLKLVPCKQTYKMHIQMHQSSLWGCSPYLCAQILIDPFPLSYYAPYVKVLPLTLSLCNFSSFIINDHKGLILDRLDYQCQSMGWGSFSQTWFNLEHLPKIFNSVWSNDKLLHTSFQGLSCTMLS